MFGVRKIGVYILLILLLLFIIFWLLINNDEWFRSGFNYKLKGASALLGFIGYFLLSFSLFLSSRWKKLENCFGGLDKIYHLHKVVGIYSFWLIFIHPFIFSLKWLFRNNWSQCFMFYFPIHQRVVLNLGSYSLWLMFFILLITIFKIFPYDKWKIAHKFMSIVFILASLHFLLSDHLFGNSYISKALLLFPMSLGICSIVYKQIIYSFCISFPKYVVKKTEKLNENLIKITFTPFQGLISFVPGQYAFLSFKGRFLTSESHPFTLCGDPKGNQIFILVKVRGDFTRKLYDHVKKGMLVTVEGPYGKFDYTQAKESQIWIAGGIGIAPFLVWATRLFELNDQSKKIDLFYAVHTKKEEIILKEFLKISEKLSKFHIFISCSERNERLKVSSIESQILDFKERSIFICGPKRMTRDFLKQFLLHKVKRRNIYFEDFEFF